MAARIVEIPVLETTLLQHHPLAPYMNVRDRELARGLSVEGGGERPSSFIAEGEVVVRVLATRGRFRIRSLLIEERRVSALQDVLDRLPESVTVWVAPQHAMNELVGFPIHRGILALGERGIDPDPIDVLTGTRRASSFDAEPGYVVDRRDISPKPDAPELVVGLVGLANHDNVGSVFRNAAAFGARGVLLDATTCDPLYRKALRVSVGAALVVPFARTASAEQMIETLEASGYDVLSLTPSSDRCIDALPYAPRRALLLGTEGPGLPASVLRRTTPVRIDMDPNLDSLNVAVASGIALYEASRRRP